MGLSYHDFDETAEADEVAKAAEAVQRREIQYALFTERWEMAGFIEQGSGTICQGFIDYLKSQEDKFKVQIEEIFGIVEALFIHSLTVRFGEAISRGYLKEMPKNILGILSGEESVSFIKQRDPSGAEIELPVLYSTFFVQMMQYYREFLEWRESKKS